MKACTMWSNLPYKPPLFDVGEIYITRIAPSETSVLIEWLGRTDSEYKVYCRQRGAKSFSLSGTAESLSFCIHGLRSECEYEIYVASGKMKSRIRLVRCGWCPGTVVNYLHPDDGAYSYSGRYLCSPSLLVHPDGYLLSSMDLYEGEAPQNLTFIFRSDDNGESWHMVCELMPAFWTKLFLHKGDVYALSCSTEYGDLLIGRSTDGGRSFSAPSVLFRGSGGKKGNEGVHKNPQNIVKYQGRIYASLEWGTWWNKDYGHAAMVMSCDENADLTDPNAWSFTEPLKFDHFAKELTDLKMPVMTIEGTLTVSPDLELLNIMRFGKRGYVIAYKVNTEDFDAPLEYKRLIALDTSFSKFTVKFDEVSKRYYTIISRLYEGSADNARNLLSLMVSDDLYNWKLVTDLYDLRSFDAALVGMQYVDFEFVGNDIYYLSRTALNGANSYHDSNCQTFHKIKEFRDL